MDRFAGTSASESVRRAERAARDVLGPSWTAEGFAIAPGRIELLGNHVDYNGGPVLAAAIDRFIAVAVSREAGQGQTLRAVPADVDGGNVGTLDASLLAGSRNASPPTTWLD